MRTEIVFNAVDPSVQQISASIKHDMRYQSFTQFVKTGVTGDPQVFLEASADDTNWDIVPNPKTGDDFTLLDDPTSDSIIVLENPMKYVRFRMEANGATGGTLTATLNRKEPN